MIVDNQNNIKVHFAGAEVISFTNILNLCNINYLLYTAFPFLERRVLGSKKSPLIRGQFKGLPDTELPRFLYSISKHCIQDSGLFTLMFGSHKGIHSERTIELWYRGLVEFTLEHGMPVTCVEVDCQKVLGVDKAWELRERIKIDLPNNRIINVFHLEDGEKGLDRLIEFSDYIAISVPELRVLGKKGYLVKLAHYIKNKKPEIDIHLLGCTELELLKQLNFCSSADSTSWTQCVRFGTLGKYHRKILNIENLQNWIHTRFATKQKHYELCRRFLKKNTDVLILGVSTCQENYKNYAGNQD